MRWANAGLALAVLLAGCGQPAGPSPGKGDTPARPAGDPRARAALQLRARLGAEPVFSRLRHGTNDGKAVLCGDASAQGGPATPFVMRGGYLVLPRDASPEQFATLQSFCTEDGPGE